MKDFLKKNSKAVIWGSAIFVVILGLALGGYFYYQNYVKNKDIVAVYNGENITKSDYEKELEQCRAGMSYDNKDTDLGTCDKKALEDIIYYKALKQEAQKYSINVSSRVETDYETLKSSFKDESEFLNTYKISFGEDVEDIKRNLEIAALEDALSDKLLVKNHVIGAFVRYDTFIEELGEEKAKSDGVVLLEKYIKKPLTDGVDKLQIETLLEQIRTENSRYNNEVKNFVGTIEVKDLNASNVDKYYLENNTKDWDEISKLSDEGSVTQIFESPKGDIIIYRLESKTGGLYNSWEDFRTKVVNDSKISLLKYDLQNLKSAVASTLYKLAGKVYAACYVHLAGFNINSVVYEGTSTHVTNLQGRFDTPTNPAMVKTGCSTSQSSGTFSTGDDSFVIGAVPGISINCNTNWYVHVESTNDKFYPTYYTNRGFDANGVNINIDHDLAPKHSAVAHYGNGSSTTNSGSELGDNDGNIFVVPKPVVSHTITPSADNGCSISPSTAQTVTAGGSSAFTGSAQIGYTFNGFSIDGGSTTAGSSYTFSNVTASHTIRALCNRITYTLTYNGNGNTGGTVPTGGTYYHGDTITAPGQGNLVKVDHLFNGWNTGCSSSTECNGTTYVNPGSFTITSNTTLYAKWTAMNLSCTVTPDNGLSPLVVRIEANTNIPSADLTYNFGDGAPGVKRGSLVYYTYETAGAYSVTVSEPRYRGGAAQSCSPAVINVSNPDSGEGGEVTP